MQQAQKVLEFFLFSSTNLAEILSLIDGLDSCYVDMVVSAMTPSHKNFKTKNVPVFLIEDRLSSYLEGSVSSQSLSLGG